MQKGFILLMLVSIFYGCEQNNQQGQAANLNDSLVVDTMAVLNDPTNNANIQTKTFLEIDSSGIVIFPLLMEGSSKRSSLSSYKNVPPNNYWNIIFYNAHNSTYDILSDKKLLISSYDYGYS